MFQSIGLCGVKDQCFADAFLACTQCNKITSNIDNEINQERFVRKTNPLMCNLHISTRSVGF